MNNLQPLLTIMNYFIKERYYFEKTFYWFISKEYANFLATIGRC